MLTEVKLIPLRMFKIKLYKTLSNVSRIVPTILVAHKQDKKTIEKDKIVETQTILNINTRIITIFV